jgi:prepilin-type processing-associated H-X9-DG protein
MNAYLGYKAPENMRRPASKTGFTIYDPDFPTTKVYTSAIWAPSRMFLLVEEHPFYHLNDPLHASHEGNFNVTDRIVTRHVPAFKTENPSTSLKGQSVIGYVDGHVESPWYSWKTSCYTLNREIGFPTNKNEDDPFLKMFIPRLPQRQ